MLQINAKRLQKRIEAMATLGLGQSGGVSRLALTDMDKKGRELLISWFEELGCTMHIDPIGNMFATFPVKTVMPLQFLPVHIMIHNRTVAGLTEPWVF